MKAALRRAGAVVEAAVARGVAPGAVAAVGDIEGGEIVAVCGVRRLDPKGGGPPVTAATRFDLASLTKVVATLPLALGLAGRGALDLDAPLRETFAAAGWMREPSLGEATGRQLLTHTSGLPAWLPLHARTNDPRVALAALLDLPLEPPLGRIRYSDPGFLLLGALIERRGGAPLRELLPRLVLRPLAMAETGYGPITGAPVAATEDCGWRGRLLEGEVHDENATVFGGAAGHAGLFGTAADLGRYARAWLRRDPALAPPGLLDEATSLQAEGEDGTRRGLGWLLAPAPSAGPAASARAFGHTGFTGTSLWIDPERERWAALLTNRVHPTRHGGEGIGELRAAFGEAVFGG